VTAPPRIWQVAGATLELGGQPWLMGIVNASPDSFSDGGEKRTIDQRLALARSLVTAGARIIDVGGESGVTNRPQVAPGEEIARVVPLIEAIVSALGVLVSVDTYKPAVARAALQAGAAIVNDTSGLRYPELAEVCARMGAGLIVMHTRAAPKQKLLDRSLDGRIVADVENFLGERIELARARGVAFDQLMIDPGPDFSKTPAQTVEVLRALPALHQLGRPLLLAASRKDFIGAITQRPPRGRIGGTLAAVGFGAAAGVHVLRIHDVAEVADFLAVRAALEGEARVDPALRLADSLRWEQGGS
jgi:dihydropteroate synthase